MSGLGLSSRPLVSSVFAFILVLLLSIQWGSLPASQGNETDGFLPVSLDLGVARSFNGFFLESFTATSSDAEGRLGAGGDISINSYSIADKLQAVAPGVTLLAGGELDFPSGRVYRGDILVGGGAAGLGEPVLQGLTPDQSVFELADLPFDFLEEFERLNHVSQELAALPANGSFEWQWGGLYLEGDCVSPAQVFELDGQQVLEAHTFQVSCIPDGATVIFNIDGLDVGLTNMSLSSLIAHRQQVLFNFHEAERLTLNGIGVEGSVLAPGAHVDQPQGVIEGTIVARSWDGPMQFNHKPFRGVGAGDFCALYPIAIPFDLLADADSGQAFHQVPRGTGPGNFSWLTWAGSPSAPVLASSLLPPGDSYTYINPDDDTDWLLSVGDWVQGAPGAMNSSAIRANLDALLGTEIAVPAWSEIRGQGNNFDYLNEQFARIRLLDYRLPGNGWLSFEFLGFTHCYNRPPVAEDQQLETDRDVALDIELAGSDPDGDDLTYEVVVEPVNGQLTGEPPLAQYVPDPGFVGFDSFEFVVRDAYLTSAPATVAIEVIETNLPPQAHDQQLETDQDTALVIELTGEDPDGDALSFELVSGPENGSLSGDAPLLTYQPAPGFIGIDSFEFVVRDGITSSAPATVTIDVLLVNRPPQIVSEAITGAVQGQPYQYPVEAVDPDPGDILTYSLEQAPADMTINPNDGLIEWFFDDRFIGNRSGSNHHCFASGSVEQGNVASADVVFVVDESGSMSGEHRWISGFTFGLESHLQANGVGYSEAENLYGLVGYTSNPRSFQIDGVLMGSLNGLMTATGLLRTSGGTEDGWEAIQFALQDYPIRDGSAHNVILITDEGRDNTDTSITFESLLQELNGAEVILNSVVNGSFRCLNGDDEWVSALGMDSDSTGYLADGQGGYLTCGSAEPVSGESNTISAYVELALATEGAAWDLNFLRSGGQDAISFARALTDIKVREILEQLPPVPQSDLSIDSVRWQNNEILVSIVNRGQIAAAAESELHLYVNDQLLDISDVSLLDAGQSLQISIPFVPGDDNYVELHAEFVLAEDDGECVTTNHQLTSPLVAVRATDTGGLFDQQLFSIEVEQVNQAPEFTSTPLTIASVGTRYRYEVQAVDPDSGDALIYRLLSAPTGMTIDPFSGQLTFTPNAAHVGTQSVEIEVEDLEGATAIQQYELEVGQDYQFPRFVPVDEMRVIVDTPYEFQTQTVSDPIAELSYEVLLGPTGLEIDSATGRVTWQVASDIAGQRIPLSFLVRDQFDNYDILIYDLLGDLPNLPPTITSSPNLMASQGSTYTSNSRVQDPNFFEQHRWSLVEGPSGMTVNETSGQVRWTGSNISSTYPEGLRDANPYCLVRSSELASVDAREDWTWTSGVSRFTQPLVLPLFFDQTLATPELEDIELVVGVTWSGGGVSSRAIHGLDLETGERYWTYSDHSPHWGVSPAAADLDSNGIPDVVFVDSAAHLVAVDSFGQFQWRSQQPVAVSGANLSEAALVIADLDQDGMAEIVAGSTVFDHAGQLLWRFESDADWHSTAFRATPMVADLTGNGQLEVAMYDQVRDAQGNLLWQLPLETDEILQRAHFGVGDLTGDGLPDLAVSLRSNRGSALLAVTGQGQLLWREESSLVQHVSPPLVADFTRSGSNEVFLPGGSILFDAQGAVVWQHNGAIDRREFRNAIATDLTGDGWLEIVMHGGSKLSVMSGQYGIEMFSWSWSERSDRRGLVPVLVKPENQEVTRLLMGGTSGLLVLRPAWGDWPTRAHSAMQLESAPAEPRHANLRIMQPPVLSEPATEFLADLHIEVPRARPVNDGKSLETVIRNRGMAPVPGPIVVEFYRGDPQAGGDLLAQQTVSDDLWPGQTVSIAESGFERDDLGDELFALVYQQDGSTDECELANNIASGVRAQIRVEDYDGLDDTQVWSLGVREPLVNPSYTSSPVREAVENELYVYQVAADDPNTGDLVTYRLYQGPKNAQLHPITGELSWTPAWGQTGTTRFRVHARDLSNRARNQTIDVVVAPSSIPNELPVILSQPVTTVQLGGQYQYPVIAEDPDGQELGYSLLDGPDGMAIHPRTGLITWTPTLPAADPVPVTVQVQDERGGVAEQSYSIRIFSGDNQPPDITSHPTLSIALGETWIYAIEATDPDGDPLVFELLQGPIGSEVDAAGLIDWTPDASQLGEHAVVVEVRDDRGGWARQSFSVYVYDGASNQPPEILSSPPQQATVGLSYSYQIEAVDPDGDVLEFVLQTGPAGAAIDPVSGLLQWTPLTSQIGLQDFELLVLDGNNGVAWQRFNVLVEEPPVGNRPPAFLSTPPQSAKTGRQYSYSIVAEDPDGDALDYRLLESPADMSLSVQDAELTWSPSSEGSYPVEIEISDGEYAVTQSWNLEVLDGSVPLGLDLEITPTVADIGQTVSIRLLPQAAAGEVMAEVLVNGTPVTVDPDLVARFEASEAGEHLVEAAIDDGFEQADTMDNFFVRDPNAEGGPIVSLSTPDYEAEITAPTMVVGTVQDDSLAGWTLAWAEAGTQNWTILAEGTEPINEAEIAMFDPTLLINGQYRIALQAWDNQGRSNFDSREVQVTGDMKLGHFAITFEDATVPLAGVPITLTRTYDTRQRNKDLDFGFGWSVGYQNVRLHESRRVGLGWSLNEYRQGLFSTWCVEPNGDPIVTVRLPDDEVHRFRAKASPDCQQLVPFIDVNIVFEALDGTDSTLTQSDFGLVRIVNGNIVDLGEPDQPIDPDAYRLTLEDGTVLSVDQHFGLRQLQDTNDNTLTFTHDGILHSSGVGIEFVRDVTDRITQVLLPDGEILDYAYDASGNLTAFVDQAENITQYSYLAGAAHYLEDIIDPRGVRAIRNEYDEDGRLVAQIDADGNRLEFDRDIEGRVETIRDRRGHATVYIYDERGNVLSETNALGETTLRSYDEYGNELTRTDPLGHLWQMSYDSRGNQTAETNPLGETNDYAYNSRGLVTSHTAADGTVVMANQYNERTGNLTASTDALGQATTFSYDQTGNLTRTIDPLGQEIQNFYDSRGNLIREIDPKGVETQYTHDVMGRVLTETQSWTDGNGIPQALVTTHDYDANGNRIRTTDPLGAVREFEFDAAGQMTAEIDPLGRRTEYEFDNRGNQVLVRHPDGSTETSVYDPEGNLIAETDRAGRTTRMVYDAAGRAIETIFPDNTPGDDSDNPRRYSIYDAAGRMVEEVDERGNSTFYEYDDAGRNTKVIDAQGNETVYEYDLKGQRTAVIDARGHRTESVYDAAGRLVRTIYPDTTESSVSYDALGQKIAETDPAGRTTRFEYDQTGNLTAVIDALDQRTEYAYDEQGNRIAQTDSNGHTTTWTFDATGRMLSRTLPLGQTEYYQYDMAGQRTARTDFNGQTTQFAYDDLSRPTRTEHPDGSMVETRYTTSGQVSEIEVTCSPAPCVAEGRELGVTVHQYDERDRLTRIQYPDGRWIEYSYDEAGNRTELLTENQRTQYTFDALNRMATVTACTDEPCSQGEVTTYHYNEVGSRSRVDHANASYTEYHYDTRNRLTTLLTAVPGQVLPELVHHQVFTLGAAGHRQKLVEDDDRVVEYSYDALYRLTEEQVTDPRGNRITTYTYDATGNRLSRTVTCDPQCSREIEAGVTTYVYDANDRLLEESGPDGVTTYSYDENGNTLQKSAPDGTVDYTYNTEDRLTQASGALESGIATEYSYDAQGIRQRQTVDGITSRFLVDPTHQYAQVLEELDAAGNSTVTYVIGHERIRQERAEGHFTYHDDGLGSIRVLTDDTGKATDTYVYEAFGQLEHGEGTTPNKFRYTGEQYDPNLGFYYLRARYYNPATGRFPTMDTYQGRIHEPQTLHKYLYVHGDPVSNFDPSGYMTLAGQLTGINIGATLRIAAIGTLAAITTRIIVGQLPDSASTGIRKWSVWDSIAVPMFRAAVLTSSIAQPIDDAGSRPERPPQGHHTIPVYLCGAMNQQLSYFAPEKHSAIHAQIAQIGIVLEGVEEYASRSIGRHRSEDVLRIAGTETGRRAITNALDLVYQQGGWWMQGQPTVGAVFSSERGMYESGMKTSLPWCTRTGSP